jgi:hypothetical protein
MAKEYDGIGHKRSGYTIMIDVGTLVGAILEDFRTSDHFPQLPKYQNFWSISIWIKEIAV